MSSGRALFQKIAPSLIFLMATIGIIAGVFTLYGNLAVDYSLQSLEFAFQVSQNQSMDKVTPVQQKIYGHLVQDIALEEAFRQKLDYKNRVLLN